MSIPPEPFVLVLLLVLGRCIEAAPEDYLAKPDGSVLSLDEFVDPLHTRSGNAEDNPNSTITFAVGIQSSKTFADDLYLPELSFASA